MLECPHRCMRDQFCIKFLNHHWCARVMEIMWDIPLPLDCWPNQHPDIYHVQLFYKLWAKIPTHQEPWPGMRIFVLALGRKQKKMRKTSSRSKIERKPKRKNSWSKLRRKQKKFPIKDRKKTKKKKKKKTPDQDRKWCVIIFSYVLTLFVTILITD